MRTIGFSKYYSCMGRLSAVFDQRARQLPLRSGSAAEYHAWKSAAREKLRTLLGLEQMVRCELRPELLETETLDYCRREKWIVQTEPDVWMPFYVLVPLSLKNTDRAPAVIATHGHRGAGKLSVAGRDEIPAVKSAIDLYHYDYGRKFCAEGCIVFCPDARGFGERREFYFGKKTTENELDEEFFLETSCAIVNQKAISLGQSLIGMWAWDLMRLVDYISTRGDCEPGRVACAGLSGGGLQTLWFAAFEDRLKCAVISGNFFGFKDSIIHLTRCSCSYIPHLCEWVDVGDVGALIAPCPLLIESATQDQLSGPRGLENAVEQVAITRSAYQVLGAEDRFHHHIFEGPHRWDGAATYPFVRRWL